MAKEVTQRLKAVILLQRTWVRLPAPTWQLSTLCNSRYRRSNALLRALGTYLVHRPPCRQKTGTGLCYIKSQAKQKPSLTTEHHSSVMLNSDSEDFFKAMEKHSVNMDPTVNRTMFLQGMEYNLILLCWAGILTSTKYLVCPSRGMSKQGCFMPILISYDSLSLFKKYNWFFLSVLSFLSFVCSFVYFEADVLFSNPGFPRTHSDTQAGL